MAFQSVNTSNTKKATGMKVGETITGYVVRIEQSRKHENQSNMVIREESGAEYLLFSAGNLRYLLGDQKIKTGLLTQITRLEDKVVKGKPSTQFDVQQDPDKTLDDVSFAAISESQPDTSSTKAAVDRASIRERAAQLTQQRSR